jgi:alpha-beta hydrolase superfamily lysophospholipase
MSSLNEFYMASADGKSRLHVMRWLPDDGNVRAVLQLAHGICEHIARYDAFARFMADKGFWCRQ